MKQKIPYLQVKPILVLIVLLINNFLFSQHNSQGHQNHIHQVMNLAPESKVTHKAVKSGNWSAPATWGGIIPINGSKVMIPSSITVIVDKVFNERLSTIRVDGTLEFSRDANAQLSVETLVTMPHSSLIIGTESNPVKQNIEAKILILDNGDINITDDSLLLSRGIIALGKIEWHGFEKTSFVKANEWFPKGTSSFELEKEPINWSIGDRIVISGILNKQQEEFTIKNIVGKTITLDHPTKNDRLVKSSNAAFKGLYPYVANYSRNVIIESENKIDAHRRGHLMFMHQQDVDIRYVQLEELGRTNKKIELEKPVTLPTTNVVGRYALHFHRAGDTDKNGKSGYVKGSVVWGSPGWGFVNHESNAWFDDNASYNVLGSHFTDENGSELGGFRRNIAIYSEGSGKDVGDWSEKTRQPGDHGHTGVGFWATTGATVRWDGNIATDQNFVGFAIISRRAPDDLHEYDYNLHDNPSQAGGQKLVNAKHVGINFFKNSINYGGKHGISIVDLELNGKYNTDNLFENFTSLNTSSWIGLGITYMRNLHLKNVKVLRDDILPADKYQGTIGIYASSTYDHLFKVSTKGWTIAEDVTIYGFINGFQLLRSRPGKPLQRDDNKLYLDTKSSLFLKGGEIADIMDADHFKDKVNVNAIPKRPYFSETPGIHNKEVKFKIIAEPGSTIYYSFGEGGEWPGEPNAMMALDLTDAYKYKGETITFSKKRSFLFAVAVKNGLQSRVQAGWYYVEDADDSFVEVSDIDFKNFNEVKIAPEGTVPSLVYQLYPSNASNKSVKWASSNEKVMTVNPETGLITAVAKGEADLIITSLSNEDVSDTTKIIVSEDDFNNEVVPVIGISINKVTLTLDIEEETTIHTEVYPYNATNKNVTWSSSEEEVAFINDLGEIIGLTPGNAVITVTTEDGGFKSDIIVTVKEEEITDNNIYKTYQGEDRTSQSGTENRNSISGFTGSGFVDFGGRDSFIEWDEVIVSEEGLTKFLFTYANGSNVDRSCELFINGASYGVLDFSTVTPGNWMHWGVIEKFIDLSPGTYNVKLVTDTYNGGPNFDKMEIIEEVIDNSISTINIFPNPTNNRVTIEVSRWEGINIKIFNQQGALMLDVEMKKEEEQLEIPNLLPGIFIIEIESITGVKKRKKLVITK